MASKILSAILIIALLGAIGTLSYVVATPITEGEYTEFYILGLAGKVGDYPTGLVVGEEGKVIVGIVNREHQPTSYNVEVRINNIKNNSAGPVSLANNEKWEQVVTFIADKVGDNQLVEFLLYKDGDSVPYLKPLQLSINVKEGT